MLKEIKHEKCSRKTFAKIGDSIEMPNLIQVQKDSYNWFIEEGLGEVLRDVSPIVDYSGNLVLEFLDYYMEEKTKYTLEEAKERDATYATRLHVKVRLINRETGEIKEQEIYLGDFPLMTDSGTFVINGAERVVVSQLVRSPGCYYAQDFDSKTGRRIYTSTVMPIRGAWIEYETDGNDVFWARVDRTRKIPVTTLLRALGIVTDEQITQLFGDENKIKETLAKDPIKTQEEALVEIYKKLKDEDVQNVNLLHSRFIQADRSEKERNIKEFSKNKNEAGIWITTQIVEASLDIDFDMLYTEMSTLDSLFQRLGRCYRSREYDGNIPNVKMYIKDTSGVRYIYDKEIYEKSIELLKPFNGKILQEKVKNDLVDKLYSKEMLQGTEFYKKFKEAFKILDNIIDYDTSKKDAQHILRDIDNIDVIPKIIYDENLNLFGEYENEKEKKKKYELKRNIDKLFISINSKNKWKLNNFITECPYVKGKYIIDTKYDKEIGLLLELDEGYSIDSREL